MTHACHLTVDVSYTVSREIRYEAVSSRPSQIAPLPHGEPEYCCCTQLDPGDDQKCRLVIHSFNKYSGQQWPAGMSDIHNRPLHPHPCTEPFEFRTIGNQRG